VVDKHKAVVRKNTKFIHLVFLSVVGGSIDDDDDDDDDDDGCDEAVHNGNMVVAVAVAVVGVDEKIEEDMAGFILNFLWYLL